MAARAGRRGFSLIELLVALVILSAAAVALVRVFTASLQGGARAGDQTTAAFLARQMVEEARAESALVAGVESGAFEGDLSAFAWSREVRKLDRKGLYKVDVAVSWRDSVAERSMRLATLLYKSQ